MNNMKMELPFEPLVDLGDGQPIILLHGLFGSLSNWRSVIDEFGGSHRVLVPRLPLYSNPITTERLKNLVDYLDSFIEAHGFDKVVLMGNSLGGHVALLYAWKRLERVEKLVLTGSSGLYENSFGGTFPHVKDYDYVRSKIENTFFKREVITKELVDEVFLTLQSPVMSLNIIALARAAQRNNMADVLGKITSPALLIWGLQDTITPPNVALEFHNLLPNSTLAFIENCGHVPMMEQPEQFNKHVRAFL